VTRARAELGLQPHLDLESGLRRTLAWLRDLR
jgi:nucleoside-diphosphate-sugar epimerase